MDRSLLLLACVAVSLTTVLAAPKSTPLPTPPPGDLETELTKLGNFTQILYLLNSAGMLDSLKATPNITLFLPTDAALARLPAATLTDLQNNPAELKALLNFHTVIGRQKKLNSHSNDLVLNSTANLPIRVNVYGNPIRIKTAEGIKVVQEDIHVANGYVHGIDGLMTPPEGSVHDVICSRPDLSTFCTLLNQTNLFNRVDRDHDITIFAPTNAAFAKLDHNELAYLTNGNHTGLLKDTLLYHMVQSTTLYSAGMRHAMTFATSDSHHDPLMLLEDNSGDIYLNHAHVSEKDISGTDGVIHVIDDVLVPTRVLLKLENAQLG